MPSQLTLINDELVLSGCNPVTAPDDGSPEWLVCSAAYDAGVEHLLDEHDWGFATVMTEIVDRTDPDDPSYQDAYAKPAGCLHVIRVFGPEGSKISNWRILGNKVLCDQSDGILLEYVQEPEPEDWPGLFTKALRHSVRAGIYRGLKNDGEQARSEEKAAEFYLGKARPRVDLEEPGKVRFLSTLVTARNTRRG